MTINKKLIANLILLAFFINFIGVLQPILRNDDASLYANIAKIIVTSNNWVDLYFRNVPWLDKPHFPFWITALSFKIFGINSFAYNLPGFIFNTIGAIYTYKLAKFIYNEEIGLISLLIYLTSFHLLTSSTFDVRAEAYLLGEITPACYYLLRYDRKFSLKSLFLASMFTAMAMMTKGIFVVITIYSGVVITWIYTKKFTQIITPKWLALYIISLTFILPELICLYLQFDLHPELEVFGHTHVSGIWWYFWGSQFGRFFNTGPIANNKGDVFFFIHTFLWAFLPWSLVFIITTFKSIRYFKLNNSINKAKIVYLLASFWVTFIVFSLTKFQLDHYTNIIMPFAAIFCGQYIAKLMIESKRVAVVQNILASILLSLTIVLSIFLFRTSSVSFFAVIPLLILVYYWKKFVYYHAYVDQIITSSSLAILTVFSFILIVNYNICKPYDSGFNGAQIVNSYHPKNVFDLDSGMSPFEFHVQANYKYVAKDNPKAININTGDYIFVKQSDWEQGIFNLNKDMFTYRNKFCGNTIDKIIPYYTNKSLLDSHLECFLILEKK